MSRQAKRRKTASAKTRAGTRAGTSRQGNSTRLPSTENLNDADTVFIRERVNSFFKKFDSSGFLEDSDDVIVLSDNEGEIPQTSTRNKVTPYNLRHKGPNKAANSTLPITTVDLEDDSIDGFINEAAGPVETRNSDSPINLVDSFSLDTNTANCENLKEETNKLLQDVNKLINDVEECSKKAEDKDDESKCCPICLEKFDKQPLGSTFCGHVFCYDCVMSAVDTLKKCPICRKVLNKKKIHYLYL